MSEPRPGTVEWFFAPEWAGGWTLTRWMFAAAAFICLAPRALGIGDAYGATDMVFTRGPFALADHVLMTPGMAWGLWVMGIVGIAAIAYGRWAFYPGMVLWAFGNYSLLFYEALNIKAYDRLLSWIALALLLSPAAQSGLTGKWRSPFARYVLLITYCASYGSTGLLKWAMEPAWWTGEVLDYHFLHPWFGSRTLGVMLSGQTWITAPMGWVTIFFEAFFPFLIWFRKINPWLLVVGFSFHFGLFVLMDVGPFFFVAVSAYPALMHPEVAREWYARFQAWRGVAPQPA